jgi:hypothetical protein
LAILAFLAFLAIRTEASAEVFIRWDQDRIPPPQALGISSIVIPATRPLAVRNALAQGYRVYLEIDAGAAATFKPAGAVAGVIVKGALSSGPLARLSQLAVPVRVAEDRGKWPHIRTNWVTRNKDVLQVTSRSSQPWLENNGALIRIAAERAAADAPPVLLTYGWQPVTVSDLDQGPRLEHYLVAMAEAGSFGADLLLPLHERFERALIMGDPDTRADWDEMRRFLDFYAWNVPSQYRPIANVGVVTADPMRAFEVMNLLTRHNLPFVSIGPAAVTSRPLADLDLLIVLDDLDGAALHRVTEFATAGGTVLVAGTSAVRTVARPPGGVRPGSDPIAAAVATGGGGEQRQERLVHDRQGTRDRAAGRPGRPQHLRAGDAAIARRRSPRRRHLERHHGAGRPLCRAGRRRGGPDRDQLRGAAGADPAAGARDLLRGPVRGARTAGDPAAVRA